MTPWGLQQVGFIGQRGAQQANAPAQEAGMGNQFLRNAGYVPPFQAQAQALQPQAPFYQAPQGANQNGVGGQFNPFNAQAQANVLNAPPPFNPMLLGVPLGRGTVYEANRPPLFDGMNAIVSPVAFNPDAHSYKLLEGCKFHGLDSEYPYDHLEEFQNICSFVKRGGEIPEGVVYMKLFPLTLVGKARMWLKSLAPGSITSWEGLREAFLEKFYPMSKATEVRDELYHFRLRHGETLSMS